MASVGPWASDVETHSTDGHFRLEIWDITSLPTRLHIIRLTLPRITPVFRLRQRLQPPITHTPFDYQILRIAHSPRSPAILRPQENDQTLKEVGLEKFSMLTLQMETPINFSDVWWAFSPYFNPILVVVSVVLRFFMWR